MLVGNDVVDLLDPENQQEAIHPRFDERVFTPVERAWLANEATAHRTRWRMWAAKESAFKVARKLDPGVRFLPRRFSVQLKGNAQAVVRYAVGRFDVSFSGADDWVHAIATLSDGGTLEMELEVKIGRGFHPAEWSQDGEQEIGRILGFPISLDDLVGAVLRGAPPPGVGMARAPDRSDGLPDSFELELGGRTLRLELQGSRKHRGNEALGTGAPPPGSEVSPLEDLVLDGDPVLLSDG